MRIEIMTVTPAMANKWLESTTFRNRNVSVAAVNRYATDMAEGRWALNGESIVLDDNGNVIDGQHRLRAVIKSGVPIQSVIVRGVDQSVFPTFDVGSKRGGHDVLAIAGYANTRTLAAILRNILTHRTIGFCNGPRGSGTVSEKRIDFLSLIAKHPGAIESAAFVQAFGKTCELLRPGSFAGFVHYECGCQDSEARDAFFRALVERSPHFPTSCPTVSLWKKHAKSEVQKDIRLSMKCRYDLWTSSWDPFVKRFAVEKNRKQSDIRSSRSQFQSA